MLQKLFRASKRNADGRLVISWDKELLKLIPSGINDIADIIHSRRDKYADCHNSPVISSM